MKVLTLFEKVNRELQMSQHDFLSYYNDTINEIVNLYGENLTLDGKSFIPCDDLSSDMCINDAYFDAMVDNIVFLANPSDSQRKSEFLRKSKNAYNRIWSRHARTLKFVRRRF